MLQVPGCHLGDAWFFIAGARAHCFFLFCAADLPRHVAWDIGHASSSDLRNWSFHGKALERGAPPAWDGQTLATGSVLPYRDRYWMAYTGNWFGPEPAIGLAYSSDLYAWKKLPTNPVTRIDERHYTAASRGSRKIPHWRDPFLRVIGDHVCQFVCATAAHSASAFGTIGMARSRDMQSWELCPPLDIDPFCEELECPQLISHADRHYLLFSTLRDLIAPERRPSTRIGEGEMFSMVGETPLGPFRLLDPSPVLPAEFPERIYAGQVVWFDGSPYLLGTIWSDGGDRISDPVRLEFTATGIRAAG